MFKELLIASSLRYAAPSKPWHRYRSSYSTYRYLDIQAAIFRHGQPSYLALFTSTAGILKTANLQTGKIAYLTQFESIKPKKVLEDLDFNTQI